LSSAHILLGVVITNWEISRDFIVHFCLLHTGYTPHLYCVCAVCLLQWDKEIIFIRLSIILHVGNKIAAVVMIRCGKNSKNGRCHFYTIHSLPPLHWSLPSPSVDHFKTIGTYSWRIQFASKVNIVVVRCHCKTRPSSLCFRWIFTFSSPFSWICFTFSTVIKP